MLGVTKAMAATATDNLTLEITVRVAGTFNLQFAATTSGLAGGPNDSATGELPNNPAVVGVNAGDNDFAAWTLTNPGIGNIHATSTAPLLAPNALATADAATFLLDNAGNKKLNVHVFISQEDTAANIAVPQDWKWGAAVGTSTFSLDLAATDSGAGGTGGTPAVSGLVGAVATYTPFTGVGVGNRVTIANDFKQFQNNIRLDLQYWVPTDVTVNTEFDVDHVTILTIVGEIP
jgi:hypothetical protein